VKILGTILSWRFVKPLIWLLYGERGDTSLSQDSTTSVERPKGCKGPGARGGDFEFLGRRSKCLVFVVFGRPNSI
jgi:hypothetical protein